ncbi:MAG: HrpE/YscL family type III secretion apparatus protein [Sulfitobacter sp.]|nr:HrpE/YscL family type III secretion apparatus protein [Sulfitobacter sp.]
MASFVRLSTKSSTLLPEARLLKEEEYLGFQEGQRLLVEARQKAERIIGQSEQALEEQKQRGYQEGMDQAKQEMATHVAETVARAADYFASVEGEVVEVVMTSVRKILGEFSDEDLTLRLVKTALHVVRSQKQVTVRVPPDRETEVRSRLHQLTSSYPGISLVEVVADSKLGAGNCVLETEIGIVDGGIDSQLQVLEKVLRSRLGKGLEKE